MWCPWSLVEAQSECALELQACIVVYCLVESIETLSRKVRGNHDWCRFHIDAAFAGVTAMLPEMQHYFEGLELADSFNTNAHK